MKSTLPEFMDAPELKGIFVGGCIERGDGSSFRAKAHAHTAEGQHRGWICIRSEKRLKQKSLLIHELAHIITGDGHSDKWRIKVKELGGRLNYWETEEYFFLQKRGIHILKRVNKKRVKELLVKYNKSTERLPINCRKCGDRIGWTYDKKQAEEAYVAHGVC